MFGKNMLGKVMFGKTQVQATPALADKKSPNINRRVLKAPEVNRRRANA